MTQDTPARRGSNHVAATATALVLLAAVAVAFVAIRTSHARAGHPSGQTSAAAVPTPPVVVAGALIADDAHGVRFNAPSPAGEPSIAGGIYDESVIGTDCSTSTCWSFTVRHGYLYPVRGRPGSPVWHVAGPAIAGPGVDPRNPYLNAVTRSWNSAIVWVTRNAFAATSDGGRHWYVVRALTHHVAVFSGGPTIHVTIGIPAPARCDYYYDYVSRSGVTWRRGPLLPGFAGTGGPYPPPSCTEGSRSRA